MLMLKWLAKQLKHVWSSTDQTMDTSRWAHMVGMHTPNMFDPAVQMNKTSPIKHDNKRNVLSCVVECLIAFKFFQTWPNTIKQNQTSWPNGKIFGHQRMFDGVWSPNISRLDRPLAEENGQDRSFFFKDIRHWLWHANRVSTQRDLDVMWLPASIINSFDRTCQLPIK